MHHFTTQSCYHSFAYMTTSLPCTDTYPPPLLPPPPLSSPTLPSSPAARYALINSTVSSKMLGAIAKAEGLHHEETLTGFKWMGNRTQQLAEQGIEVIFAYEEAIGE